MLCRLVSRLNVGYIKKTEKKTAREEAGGGGAHAAPWSMRPSRSHQDPKVSVYRVAVAWVHGNPGVTPVLTT
jgi:hypothetical protein